MNSHKIARTFLEAFQVGHSYKELYKLNIYVGVKSVVNIIFAFLIILHYTRFEIQSIVHL